MFESNGQQEGEKATIEILTYGEITLYKILDLNGNDEIISPYGEPQICVDPQTNEPTGAIIYTYECNVGDSIQLLANDLTTNTFKGWFGNYGDTEFEDLTADSFGPEYCLGYEMDGDEQIFYSTDYRFTVIDPMNRFEAFFEENEHQGNEGKAVIGIATNGTVTLTNVTVDSVITPFETREFDGGVKMYVYECSKSETVRFAVSGNGVFMGWMTSPEDGQEEDMPTIYDYLYDEQYENQEAATAAYKADMAEFLQKYCIGGYEGEIPDNGYPQYNQSFELTITEDEIVLEATFMEQMQPTGSIQIMTNDEIGVFLGDAQIQPAESTEKVTWRDAEYTVYTYPCNIGDQITLSATGNSKFLGWYSNEEIGFTEETGFTDIGEQYYEFLFSQNNLVSERTFNEIDWIYNTTYSFEMASNEAFFAARYYVEPIPDTVVEYTVLDQLTCAITHVGADYFNDERTSFEIPQKVTIDGKEYTVTAIGDNAFLGCRNMASVKIPNTITTIGNGAFYSVEKENGGLTSIEIPNSVTSIGENAFYACRYLETVTLPTGITSIPNGCFCDCWNLKNINSEDGIVIPENVTSIGNNAFYNCKDQLTKVTIPDGVTYIGNSAFFFCHQLTSISVPSSVEYVGETAFPTYSDDNLSFIEKDGAKYLGYTEGETTHGVVLIKYSGTSKIVNLESDCKFIYDYAFSENRYIDTVYFPSNLKGIGTHAFISSNLKTANLPEGVTYVRECAFFRCQYMSSVNIPSTIETIGKDAFNFAIYDNEEATLGENLYKEYDGALYLGNSSNEYLCLAKAESKEIETCTINENCEFILSSAFSGCNNLNTLVVPNSVTHISEDAFNGVKNIIYDGIAEDRYGDNWGAAVRNGCVDGYFVFSDNSKTTLVKYMGNDQSSSVVTIPNTVETIGARAFYGDNTIEKITIPNSVKTIGDYAFYCDYGTKLKTLTIPSSVTTIGSYAFYGILNVSYDGPAVPNKWKDGENWAAHNLNAPMDDNFIYADAEMTFLKQYFGTDTEVEIPNTVTTIGEMALYNTNITSVSIPESVTKIEEDAFRYSSRLQSVTFASVAALCNITFVNEYSNPMYPEDGATVELYFGNDEEPLTNLEIPELDTIGQYAFYNCKQLQSVSIPASVRKIGNNAFGRCGNISKMTIAEPSNGNGLQEIGYKAFNECSFRTIALPNTLTTIGDNAFDNCDNLVSVVIPESVTSMGGYVFSYIDSDIVIFCLETNDDNNASRYDNWNENWDGSVDWDPSYKVAVVKENRKTEEPNIVRDEDGDGNGLLYFVYNGSNLVESTLKNLITVRNNVTFQNGDAFAIGYHGTRSQSLSLGVPATVGNNDNPVVAIARYAFYGENLTYFTLGSSDGSKGAVSIQSNIKIIGMGAFCGITSDFGFYTQISNWGKYSYDGRGTATNQRLDGYLTADELKQNSCDSEYYVDE